MTGAIFRHFQGQVYGRGSVLSFPGAGVWKGQCSALSLRDINRTIKLESIHSSWPVSHHACCVTTAAAVSCSRRTRRRCRRSRPLAAIYPCHTMHALFCRLLCPTRDIPGYVTRGCHAPNGTADGWARLKPARRSRGRPGRLGPLAPLVMLVLLLPYQPAVCESCHSCLLACLDPLLVENTAPF
eukprot:COSAG06_NODE_3082_length_5885_cov_4.044245_7_plen_184_part_00